MNLSPKKKIAGVLAPLFALRGEVDLGIGDVAALRDFIDLAAGIVFKLVQLLPINEIGADNSPYNAISAIAIEPTTLHLAPGSPQDLTRQDFDASLNEADVSGLRGGAVRYRQVKELKKRLLEKAFENFSANASENRRSEFRKFFQQESAWLGDYVLFRVLMEVNKDSAAWDRWPAQHRRIERARNWLHNLPQDQQAALAKRQEFFCYIQWIAHQQWRATKSFAEERGVELMGDIPFGVSYCSADVFAQPDEFVLDWFGGAPPEPYFEDDAFTRKWGQNWGIPLYRWSAMRVSGEDLGVVPEYVRPSLQSLGFAGFKIPQWETRDGVIIPGEMYERLSVATYATHDHSPIRALWNEAFANAASNTGAQARATLEKIALFAGLGGNSQGAAVSSPPFQSGADLEPPLLGQLDFEKDFYPAIMEALFKCNSWIAIVTITDLLACKYRFNVPGTKATLNWTRRMQRSVAELKSSRKEQKRMQLIHQLLEKTGRV